MKEPSDDKSLLNDKGKEPVGAPEKYSDFKVPDGYKLDTKAIETVAPVFKELNLSQDQAQKLVDTYSKLTQEAAEAPLKAYTELQKTWKADAEARFGKDIEPGGKIVTEFAKAIDSALPPTLAKNFRAALDFTGVGNNPDFIEGFRVFAKLLGEGTLVLGGKPSPGGQNAPGTTGAPTIAQAMYPNLPSANAGR